MQTAELKQLIKQGESIMTEFKERLDQEAIETASAFANTDGGSILIGVSDDRETTGITIGKETLRDMSNRISQAIDPRVILEVESVDVEEKSALLVHIAESSIKPVSVKGICYKRVGNSNRVMSPQEIAQMHLKSVGQTWDQLSVASVSRDDIDEQKIQWYLTQRETRRNVAQSQGMNTTDLLRNINCIDDGNIPTHAGILFFGKHPQRVFQNAQL